MTTQAHNPEGAQLGSRAELPVSRGPERLYERPYVDMREYLDALDDAKIETLELRAFERSVRHGALDSRGLNYSVKDVTNALGTATDESRAYQLLIEAREILKQDASDYLRNELASLNDILQRYPNRFGLTTQQGAVAIQAFQEVKQSSRMGEVGLCLVDGEVLTLPTYPVAKVCVFTDTLSIKEIDALIDYARRYEPNWPQYAILDSVDKEEKNV